MSVEKYGTTRTQSFSLCVLWSEFETLKCERKAEKVNGDVVPDGI